MMDLARISNNELLVRLEKLAKTERKITHLVLWHINEMESRKLYAEMGFGSTYEYLTKHLGYVESSAYRRIQSARLIKQIPHLAEKLEDGSLNLTQLTQVQKCLKEEKKSGASVSFVKTAEILEKIENKSNFETQKVLALEFNQPIQMHEVVTPQRDRSVLLEIPMSEEQMQLLQEAKDLASHILPEASWAQVIAFLAQKHIEKVKGRDRASTQVSPENRNTTQANQHKKQLVLHTTQGFFAKQKRKYITLKVRRELFQRAIHCCEYIDPASGRKCESRYQLEIDHRVPLARGGEDQHENLRVLCRTHNLLSARQWGLGQKTSKLQKSM
jgi:5-methylcytosine-specific restriction endonuclease McrA